MDYGKCYQSHQILAVASPLRILYLVLERPCDGPPHTHHLRAEYDSLEYTTSYETIWREMLDQNEHVREDSCIERQISISPTLEKTFSSLMKMLHWLIPSLWVTAISIGNKNLTHFSYNYKQPFTHLSTTHILECPNPTHVIPLLVHNLTLH